ncbi:MAG: M14 family zinc carboxypeptidase [Gemmatimonadota bacterium]
MPLPTRTLPQRVIPSAAHTLLAPVVQATMILAALLAPSQAGAQLPGTAPGEVAYNPTLSSPAQAFGHELGERPVRYDLLVQYFRELATGSDRVSIRTIGHSHEGRPMELLVITSPENHARLEEIRSRHLILLGEWDGAEPDIPGGSPASPGDAPGDLPVIVWLGYGVHGAEAAGLESSLPLVHHLAAGQGEGIEQLLQDAVVLVVAALNPDGHARRIDRQLSFSSRIPVRNPDHAGHDLWASQRANHYGFDLNRQWLLLAHPEPQAWMEVWQQWRPTVSADFHEMGTTSTRPTTYFFSPGPPAQDHPLIPQRARELVGDLSRYHQAALDREARLYFTQEAFSNFYIGTGSSYPTLHGSVGILFEVGTAHAGEIDGEMGRRTLADNIQLHFTSALTSLQGAVELRDELQAHQRSFPRTGRDAGAADPRGAYLVTSPDRTRLAYFVDNLNRHGIRVHDLAEEITLEGVRYEPGHAVVVPLAQGAYRMIQGVFDRELEFQDPVFSDVNGWTLPLAYGLDHAPLGRAPGSLLGGVTGPVFPQAEAPDRASYGYMFSWTDHYAPRALHRLLAEGLMPRAALTPVTVQTTRGDVELEAGAIFLPFDGQGVDVDRIHELAAEVAQREGIPVHALVSGRTREAGSDLGSGAGFGTVQEPTVLLLFEDGIQRFDMGHIWHLLDARMEMPVTLKEKSRILEIDWRRYTHIILPGGPSVGLEPRAAARLEQWIREDGGTLIGLRQGAAWIQETMLGVPAQLASRPDDAPGRLDLAEFDRVNSEHRVSGVIVASDLDITHPLGFGFHRREVASHRDTSIRLATPENPFATVARYHEPDPLLSGYASPWRREQMAGSPMMVAERLGSGTVVLMVDNPNFRSTYLGTNKLLLNSLFFSKLFGSPGFPGGAGFRR